jgi:hypothetical protein
MGIFLRARVLAVLGVLLLAWHARAQAPRLIVVLTQGAWWWNDVQLPPGTALGGLSDPAILHNLEDMPVTLGSGGRNYAYRVPLRVVEMPDGWRIAGWEELQARNVSTHAGTVPGTLGEALHGIPTVLAATSEDDALLGMLLLADYQGRGRRWLHTIDLVPSPLLTDAVVVLVDRNSDGLDSLNRMRRRFPGVPVLDISLSPGGENVLPPVALYGRGSGLLTSTRTRWQGVVSAPDIVPTILSLAHVPVPTALGRPLTVTPQPDALRVMKRLVAQTSEMHHTRPAIILAWALCMGLLSLGALALRSRRATPFLFGFWGAAVLLVYGLPSLWFLPLPWRFGLLAVGWLLAAAVCARLPFPVSWAWATGGAGGVYALTTLTNGVVARLPYLGLDVLSGHRYFGVGNEGMGVMLVLLTLWLGWLRIASPRYARVAAIGLYALLALLLALPWWGANWGGGMTALAAGLVFLGVPVRLRLKPWHLALAVVALVLAGVAFIVAAGVLNTQAPTHAGDLWQAVLRQGWAVVWTTLARKAAFFWHVMRDYGGWLILPGGIAYGLLLRRAWTRLPVPAEHRPLWQALHAAWIAALLAGLLNDSGMTLSGLMWLVSLPAFAVLVLHVPLAPPERR